MKERYGAPQPHGTYGENLTAAQYREFDKNPPLYIKPLAVFLGQYIEDGNLVVDAGCGLHPVVAEALRQKKGRLSQARMIGIEKDCEDDSSIDHVKKNVRDLANQCFIVEYNLDILSRDTSLTPERVSPECCKKLELLKGFLGTDPEQIKADVLHLGGILPYISLGEPVDFLLAHVQSGGKVIVSGVSDDRWKQDKHPPKGRYMSDFQRYLEKGEGMTVLAHGYTGYTMTPEYLQHLMREAIKNTFAKRLSEVPANAVPRLIAGDTSNKVAINFFPFENNQGIHQYEIEHTVAKHGRPYWRGSMQAKPRIFNHGKVAMMSDHEILVLQKNASSSRQNVDSNRLLARFFRFFSG